MIPIPLVCLMYSTLDPAEYVEIARVVQVEAYRNSNDEYGVAANVMNRVASDDFPDSIQGVINQPHQYDGLKRFPNKWELFKLNSNGYSFVKSFDKRPDDETIILNL